MTRASPEYRLQKAIVQHLMLRRRPNIYFCAIPNGGGRSGRTAKHLQEMGLRAGAPDLMFIIHGRVFGLELKAKRGKLSASQEAACAEWRAAGGLYRVADNINDALAFLTEIGALAPEGSRITLKAVEPAKVAA